MKLGKGNITGNRKHALILIMGIPLSLILLKLPFHPFGGHLSQSLSLSDVDPAMLARLQYVLFVPFGALLVVLTRLTLGIRVLGPFRSILLAIAFQITGILYGLVFLTIVITTITMIRPTLKAIRLPYFGRVSVILSAVAAIVVVVILAGEWIGIGKLQRAAYFPIVVLCLTGDGFARTLQNEGPRSALWRGTMTALLAILITELSYIEPWRLFLFNNPEFLVFEIGLIILVCEYLDFRLLAHLNPVPLKKKKSSSKPKTKRSIKSETEKKTTKQRPAIRKSETPGEASQSEKEELGAGAAG